MAPMCRSPMWAKDPLCMGMASVQALLCGYVARWLCGYVAMWRCGYVAMQLCGSVAMWLCKDVELCANPTLQATSYNVFHTICQTRRTN